MAKHFRWPPPKRHRNLSIAIPSSIISIQHHLREKTFVAGIIARAAAIFRTDIVALYKDPNSKEEDLKILKSVLRYMKEPPYLRKQIIPLTKELRYAGILPPLATPNHPLISDELTIGSIREALIITKNDKLYANIGLDELCKLTCNKRGGKTYVVVTKLEPLICKCIDETSIPNYMCYKIETYNSLTQVINKYKSRKWHIIISTKKGEVMPKIKDELIKRIKKSPGIIIIFGSPKYDPDEILALEGSKPEEVLGDCLKLNSAPLQGVRSIRTYEALFITLSLINSTLYEACV